MGNQFNKFNKQEDDIPNSQTSEDITDSTMNISEGSSCFNDNNEEIDIKQCDYLQRMLDALKYYRLLKMDNDDPSTNTNEVFISFCNTAYTQLLNDYQHIIATHEPHLEELNNQILNDDNYGKCKYSECNLSRRSNDNSIRKPSHQQSIADQTGEINKIDPKFVFYREILDSMHYYLWHLFEVGMRINSKDLVETDQENEIEGTQHMDKRFATIADHVRNKRTKRRDSTRFGDDNTNNKFKLNVTDKKHDNSSNDAKATFLDILCDGMTKTQIDDEICKRFTEYVKDQHFDTDAMNEDVMEHQTGSNVISEIGDQKFAKYIIDAIEDHNSMHSVDESSLHSF